uniref:Reverse transcriptase n=1 Tax=Cannabis sativa TaxID=3483 RepID=A0A803PVF5_CANSA
MYWQKRSRVDWLQSGDQNTKFFHAHASSRKANNKIKFLKDMVMTSKASMTAIISKYFADLFTASPMNNEALEFITSTIPIMITAKLNESFLLPFIELDVLDALKFTSPDKNLRSDGMSATFYQNYWHIVGPIVNKVVLGVLNEGHSMELINTSIITLILKIKSPQSMGDFRPISMCNVIYKLISKMLVMRFKEALRLW